MKSENKNSCFSGGISPMNLKQKYTQKQVLPTPNQPLDTVESSLLDFVNSEVTSDYMPLS